MEKKKTKPTHPAQRTYASTDKPNLSPSPYTLLHYATGRLALAGALATAWWSNAVA